VKPLKDKRKFIIDNRNSNPMTGYQNQKIFRWMIKNEDPFIK
jgi:hypothetical protein